MLTSPALPDAIADTLTVIAEMHAAIDRLAARVAPAHPAPSVGTTDMPPPRATGTEDVTTASAVAARATLPERVEAALRAKPRSLDEICHEVRAPAGPVNAILKRYRAARTACNVGTEDRPRWFWRIGDDSSPEELQGAIEALIKHRPLSHAELMTATGARRGRVSGVLVKLERSGRALVKFGDPRRFYYAMTE